MTSHRLRNVLGFPDIPEDRIAQIPLSHRDQAKLMVMDRDDGSILHRVFADLVDYVSSGDALILNDVRVLPARMVGKKLTGGRATVLLLGRYGDSAEERWTALVTPRPRPGMRILFSDGFWAEVVGARPEGEWDLVFSQPVTSQLDRLGRMPLPPYIKRAEQGNPVDIEAYQTVYATGRVPEGAGPLPLGAVAAPTAGLHFTQGMLDRMKGKGVRVRFVTLWVGWGTFRPIATEDYRAHRMLPEPYRVPQETADTLRDVRQEGKKVWAVGTTVARALESAAEPDRTVRAGCGLASLYITPGYSFRVVDRFVTNFHMPGHTPLVLTAAFAGVDPLRRAYIEALSHGYRFFSYGDSMAVV